MIDLEQTIISQFANSPTILALIQGMNTNIDPRANIAQFLSYVADVTTAQGFGLDIWGRRVGLKTGRSINTTPATILNDSDFRSLILLKALRNISRSSAPAINQLLQNWLGSGVRAYMTDQGHMQITYVFEFLLTPVQIEIVSNSGAFPRPSGVGARMITSSFPVFGFKQMRQAAPFNQAPFLAEDAKHAIS